MEWDHIIELCHMNEINDRGDVHVNNMIKFGRMDEIDDIDDLNYKDRA